MPRTPKSTHISVNSDLYTPGATSTECVGILRGAKIWRGVAGPHLMPSFRLCDYRCFQCNVH